MSRCIAFTPSDDKIVIWYDVQSIILEPAVNRQGYVVRIQRAGTTQSEAVFNNLTKEQMAILFKQLASWENDNAKGMFILKVPQTAPAEIKQSDGGITSNETTSEQSASEQITAEQSAAKKPKRSTRSSRNNKL